MSVDLSDLTDELQTWINRAAGQALDGMRQRARERAPYGASEDGREGPHLVETEEAIVLDEGESWMGELAYTADHASYLDEGTGPHEIQGNPLLAFHWGGQLVIVHSVQHPGSTRHVGWFSETVTEENWAYEVQNALDAESF